MLDTPYASEEPTALAEDKTNEIDEVDRMRGAAPLPVDLVCNGVWKPVQQVRLLTRMSSSRDLPLSDGLVFECAVLPAFPHAALLSRLVVRRFGPPLADRVSFSPAIHVKRSFVVRWLLAAGLLVAWRDPSTVRHGHPVHPVCVLQPLLATIDVTCSESGCNQWILTTSDVLDRHTLVCLNAQRSLTGIK